MSNGYRRIPVVFQTFDEAKAELEGRIRYGEQKYGMSSAEMEELVSTGDDKWETLGDTQVDVRPITPINPCWPKRPPRMEQLG